MTSSLVQKLGPCQRCFRRVAGSATFGLCSACESALGLRRDKPTPDPMRCALMRRAAEERARSRIDTAGPTQLDTVTR